MYAKYLINKIAQGADVINTLWNSTCNNTGYQSQAHYYIFAH